MRVAIYGASGFLGSNLITRLLETTDWEIVAIARRARRAVEYDDATPRLVYAYGDVRDEAFVASTLEGVDVAYYFIHFMGYGVSDYDQREQAAAVSFARVVDRVGLGRIIYMGGLGEDSINHSRHLLSRYVTGIELRKARATVIEFKAAMIIGQGSVAYDIIQTLVEKLPFIVLPKTAKTLTQPIACRDAVTYLVAAATFGTTSDVVIEIGGPTALSYEQLYRRYACWRKKRVLVLYAWFLSPRLEALVLNLFMPKVHTKIGREMVESMRTDMIVTRSTARDLLPAIMPLDLEAAFDTA